MNFVRMPIEIESPEEMGFDQVRYNLTESSFTDKSIAEIGVNLSKLVLSYSDHRGHLGMRKLLAQESGLRPEQVLLTPGAAGALFFLNTTLLKQGDHILVEHPNYGTNIETPRAIGVDVELFSVSFEKGFLPIPSEIFKKIKSNTKMVSLCLPHNPTGTQMSEEAYRELVLTLANKGIWVLVDETYREMAFEKKLPIGATLHPKVISVSSLSKTYGLPGIRLGWLLCQDEVIMEKFLAAKEQVVICGSTVDEEIAYQFYSRKDLFLESIQEEILKKRKVLVDWLLKEEALEFVKPIAGVVCFPRIKKATAAHISKFYETLNKKYQTFVGPGHWFEMDKRYFRIGYAWPNMDDLNTGLKNISCTLRDIGL